MVTILDNGAEFALSFWAAHKLQCPFVPLDPRNVASKSEMNHMPAVAQASVVIVGNHELATAFDELAYHNGRGLLKIVSGETAPSGWVAFSDLLMPDAGEAKISIVDDTHYASASNSTRGSQSREVNNPVTILFTSGTTSLPKGCPYTNQTLNAFMKNLALGGSSPGDVFCSVLPNNHAMGYFYVLHFFSQGGAVVYPAATFNPRKMAKALAIHACTHACLVPTALHSLIDHSEREDVTFPAPKDVCLAEASITPQQLRQVVRKLGSRGVFTDFGMTEGSPIWVAATSDPETLVAGDDTISGSASPGAFIKICDGPGVIAGYLGDGVGTENFYVDEGRTWFKTGDRAVMHPDGRVSVVGRYKDMIIRGGENIAPLAIEAVLNQSPGVEAQVVAAQDPFAGEVPVAIVRQLPSGYDPRGLLSGAVRNSMEAPSSNFADSITIMRVRDMFRKDLGFTITANEMIEYPSLRSQIHLLEKKSGRPQINNAQALDVVAPLSLEAIQLVIHPEDATLFKEKASAAVSEFGFDFDQDVDAIIQASDFTNNTSLFDLDASDVAGPTMNAATNLIPVHRSESALSFLKRLQSEQAELTKHAHAPWRRIMAGLDALHPGENAGNMLPEIHETQFLTWVPGFLGDYENIHVAQIAIRSALGLVFVGGLGGPKATTYMLSLRWDVANYSREETERFVGDMERAVVWLLEEENWEREVGGFLDEVTAGRKIQCSV
ncbi:hypothetical protein MBLNU13_g02961t1 [Cladosporium sp. NU13]